MLFRELEKRGMLRIQKSVRDQKSPDPIFHHQLLAAASHEPKALKLRLNYLSL